MSDIKQLSIDHLKQVNILQLATAKDNKPWICTVHFYADDELNIYWVSRTDRIHSKQIDANPNVSATAVVHVNTLDEDYVIAVTLAGQAEVLTNAPAEVRQAYQTKLNKPANMLPDPEDPNNLQEFYVLKPEKLILFDTKNLAGNPRQEISL